MIDPAPHAFDAKANVSLEQLPALNGLLRTFKAPPMESGAVFGKIAGTGQLRPWQASGDMNVTATQVRTGKMPQPADAVIDGTFAGTSADLGKFEAKLGPWRVAAAGSSSSSTNTARRSSAWSDFLGGPVNSPDTRPMIRSRHTAAAPGASG